MPKLGAIPCCLSVRRITKFKKAERERQREIEKGQHVSELIDLDLLDLKVRIIHINEMAMCGLDAVGPTFSFVFKGRCYTDTEARSPGFKSGFNP